METLPKSPTVLLVEDDRSTRSVLRSTLARAGYRVLEATRLKEATELMRDQEPDLLLIDGLLPDGTGMAFIEQLRATGFQAPILFLSAFFKDFRSFRTLSEGLKVTSVLQKPIHPDTLMASVSSALAAV